MVPLVAQYLTAAGDGTGPVNANLNFGAPTEWSISEVYGFPTLPTPQRIILKGMNVLIHASDCRPGRYGDINGGLANGIQMAVKNGGGIIQDLLAGVPMKTNADWQGLSDRFALHTNNNCALRYYLDLRSVSRVEGIELLFDEGEFLSVTFDDDLSGLIQHQFFVFGEIGGSL